MTRYINQVEKVGLSMSSFREMHGGPPHAVADAVARGFYKPWWTESRLKPSGARGKKAERKCVKAWVNRVTNQVIQEELDEYLHPGPRADDPTPDVKVSGKVDNPTKIYGVYHNWCPDFDWTHDFVMAFTNKEEAHLYCLYRNDQQGSDSFMDDGFVVEEMMLHSAFNPTPILKKEDAKPLTQCLGCLLTQAGVSDHCSQ